MYKGGYSFKASGRHQQVWIHTSIFLVHLYPNYHHMRSLRKVWNWGMKAHVGFGTAGHALLADEPMDDSNLPPGSVLPLKEVLREGSVRTIGTVVVIDREGLCLTASHCVVWEDRCGHPQSPPSPLREGSCGTITSLS